MPGMPLISAATESVTRISQAFAVSSPSLLAAFTNRQDVAVANPDTKQDLFGIDLIPIIFFCSLLHRYGALDRLSRPPEKDEHAIALDFNQHAIIRVDARLEDALRLVNDLQEVNNAKLGHKARKTRKVGEHDRPGLTKNAPDSSVDCRFIGPVPQSLGNKRFKALQGATCVDARHGLHCGLPFLGCMAKV
jgi:hypothetical protein